MAEDPKTKSPQELVTEIGVEDLYEFIGVDFFTSSEKEVNLSLPRHVSFYYCVFLS